MDDEKELLRPADLAVRLGVTSNRVYQLLREGVIPSLRVGGSLRVPRSVWVAWLEEQRERAIATAEAARRKSKKRRGRSGEAR